MVANTSPRENYQSMSFMRSRVALEWLEEVACRPVACTPAQQSVDRCLWHTVGAKIKKQIHLHIFIFEVNKCK